MPHVFDIMATVLIFFNLGWKRLRIHKQLNMQLFKSQFCWNQAVQ